MAWMEMTGLMQVACLMEPLAIPGTIMGPLEVLLHEGVTEVMMANALSMQPCNFKFYRSTKKSPKG